MPEVVLLSPAELPINLEALLLRPRWKRKVRYIRGSALDNADLLRANVAQSQGIFLIPER